MQQACDHSLAKFNQDEFMSSEIPYKFHVTERELLFQKTLLEYRYLNMKHTLVDIIDQVVQNGTEVNHECEWSRLDIYNITYTIFLLYADIFNVYGSCKCLDG